MYNPAALSLERYYEEPSDYNKETYQTKTLCLEGVRTCHFSYFDGSVWQERWEESREEIPKAIKISFKFQEEDQEKEFIVHIPISP